MQSLSWLFGIPVALGILLVLCSALGAAEVGDLDSATEPASGDFHELLSWLGIGRVPLLIIVMFLLLSFGAVGLLLCPALTQLLGSQLGFWCTVPAAGVSALTATGLSALVLEPIFPRTETYAPEAQDLIGLQGRVAVRLREAACIVRVMDAGGAEHLLSCQVTGAEVFVGDAVELIARERQAYVVCKVL